MFFFVVIWILCVCAQRDTMLLLHNSTTATATTNVWIGTMGFMLKGAVNFVLKRMYTFFRRKMISIWVFGHGVPKESSMWKAHPELFLENSGTASLRSYLSARTPTSGVTIFWAIEGAGKTFALSRVSTEFQGNRHRFIYIDCLGSTCDDIKQILYRKLGMDPQDDLGRFSSYLPSDVFTTIVIDHFTVTAVSSAFISSLARDSMHSASPSFNVLVLLSNPAHALALLTDKGSGDGFLPMQYVKLLGPSFCGRWCSDDLLLLLLTQINEKKHLLSLVDQCGTLLPFLFNGPSNAHMQLKIAQSQLAWEDGERILAGYREAVKVSDDDDDCMV